MRGRIVSFASLVLAFIFGAIGTGHVAFAMDAFSLPHTYVSIDDHHLAECTSCLTSEFTDHTSADGVNYVEFSEEKGAHNTPVTMVIMDIGEQVSWCSDTGGLLVQELPGNWYQRVYIPENPDYFCGYTPKDSSTSFQYSPTHMFLGASSPDELAKAAGLTNYRLLVD